MQLDSIVIGIGGMSRSGKTTLALALSKKNGSKSIVLHLDDFVFSKEKLPLISHEGETRIDWEQPSTIDWIAFEKAILAATLKHDFVFVEGFLLYFEERIRSLIDIKYIIQIPKSLFLERRRRAYTPQEPSWFIEHVWTAYQRQHAVFELHKDIRILAATNSSEGLSATVNFILNKMK